MTYNKCSGTDSREDVSREKLSTNEKKEFLSPHYGNRWIIPSFWELWTKGVSFESVFDVSQRLSRGRRFVISVFLLWQTAVGVFVGPNGYQMRLLWNWKWNKIVGSKKVLSHFQWKLMFPRNHWEFPTLRFFVSKLVS